MSARHRYKVDNYKRALIRKRQEPVTEQNVRRLAADMLSETEGDQSATEAIEKALEALNQGHVSIALDVLRPTLRMLKTNGKARQLSDLR
jgi:arginase family enzyme